VVQLWERLNTFFNLDLIQFYVNKPETSASSRCNPETQQRALGISMSRCFRAAPGLCPELVVLPCSMCPLTHLVLSLGHSTLYFHTQRASLPWFPRPSATGQLTWSIRFPLKFLKYFRCNEINLKKDDSSALAFPPNYHLPLFSSDLLRLKPLSHQAIPIYVSEININGWPFSTRKALHSNAGPHWCQGGNNSCVISIKSAFSCQNSDPSSEYSATVPPRAASNLYSTRFSSSTVSTLQASALPRTICLLRIRLTLQFST